ncbi:sulfotransferase family protein [Candidatus Palauibacter sp.]|uniref:sulfotransferase family protein n=1 Tax=Candidatus Palauibacter sp. TaxID=3101350 RepID=UPI003B021FB6
MVGTGRCGSTMLSNIVRRHPDMLSVSEFFTSLGSRALFGRRLTGEAVFRRLDTLSVEGRALLENGFQVDEFLYRFGPGSRYRRHNVPPIMGSTLPHITEDAEGTWDELAPVLRHRGKETLADQYRFVFDWLAHRFGKSVWIERSGASLPFVATLARMFPDARFVHIHRDGRDTAMSMRQHHFFRWRVLAAERMRRLGIDPFHERNLPGTSPWVPLLSLIWFKLIFRADRYRREVIELASFGRFWSDMIERGAGYLSALPRERVLTMRYESVLACPHEELARFVRFVGREFEDPVWIDSAAALVRPQDARWPALDPEEHRALADACQPGQSILGYGSGARESA